MAEKIIRKWRIVSMETWDKDYIDLVSPGYISFDDGNVGYIHFGCIEANIDYRIVGQDSQQVIEFSFEGQDEYDPISGRGKVSVKDRKLNGIIYIHMGDESLFVCEPFI